MYQDSYCKELSDVSQITDVKVNILKARKLEEELSAQQILYCSKTWTAWYVGNKILYYSKTWTAW